MQIHADPAVSVSPILHVITCLDVGGAEVALKKLILADPAARTRHVVVSLRDVGPVGRELMEAGVVVHSLGMRSVALGLGALLRLRSLIARTNPSVVQTWLYHGDFVGGLAARLAGHREIVWGVHNTQFAKGHSKLTIGVMRACALLSRWLPRVIVCCAEAARSSHVRWGYRSDIMRVIPNGFDVPDPSFVNGARTAMRTELGIADEEILIGIVARFDPIKDHRSFIAAAGLLQGTVNLPLRFLFVGRGLDGANEQVLRWIRDARVEGRCILLGERSDVQRCFAAMDIFCLTSLHEAFPNVIGEAMAMGLPCVVTDAGDASRIVGATGSVVPPGNPAAMARALKQVVTKPPAERKLAGLAARQRIERDFGMKNTRILFERAYLDASERQR